MRVVAWSITALLGCSAVYDAQYNDREAQLEKSRTLFLDGHTQPSFFSAGQDRIFWVDIPQVVEVAELHSIDTRGSAQVDYAWSKSLNSTQVANLGLGDQLVVECEVGIAFDATDSTATMSPFPTLDGSALATFGQEMTSTPPTCVIAGSAAVYIGSNGFVAWAPGVGSDPAPVASLGAINVAGNNFGLADANNILYQEGENLWLVPINGQPPTVPLEPTTAAVSNANDVVAFDDEGVVYLDTNSIVEYIRYSQPGKVTAVSDLIAAGGYSLNYDHNGVQQLTTNATYTMFDHHLIYQGSGGIFALGMDTGNVVDLLLDGLPDTDGNVSPSYVGPTVTDNGTLFVQDLEPLTVVKPIYSVDLNDRLK
jgi:hypothetical protein